MTRIAPAPERGVSSELIPLWISIFYSPKQLINNRGQPLIFHFNQYISRGNSFNLKGHGKEALRFHEGDLSGGSNCDSTCRERCPLLLVSAFQPRLGHQRSDKSCSSFNWRLFQVIDLSLTSPQEETWGTRSLANRAENILLTHFGNV